MPLARMCILSTLSGCRSNHGPWASAESMTFICCLLLCYLGATGGLNLSKCDAVLGMQNGDIEDSALSASSSVDVKRRGPSSASNTSGSLASARVRSYDTYVNLLCCDSDTDDDRLQSALLASFHQQESVSQTNKSTKIRMENGDGAWCPKQPISAETYEYLEVDLRQLKVITMVETQGRFGNGQGTEHTDQYRLEYQREDGGVWIRFKNRRGQEIFQGNSNTYIAEMREVQPPMIARRIRFIPISTHPKIVCLRVELYGCLWADGAVSYDVPQGQRYGSDLDLVDLTYDGTGNNILYDGLGQLMDGEEGQANFRLDPLDHSTKGSKWIGWRNDSFSGQPLSIVFKFDALRNFSMVQIHCNNKFSKGVRVFHLAKVYFSAEGKVFLNSPTVEYTYARDSQMEYARPIKISLNNNIGQFVKLELYFDDKWIMISEIQFESERVRQVAKAGEVSEQDNVAFSSDQMTVISISRQSTEDHPTKKLSEHNTLQPPQKNQVLYDEGTPKIEIPEGSSSNLSSTTTAVIWKRSDLRSGLDYGSVVVMIIVLTVLLVVLCSVILLIFYRRHKLVCMSGPCGTKKSSAMLTNPPSNSSISRPSSLLYPSSYLIHSASYRPSYPVPSYTISQQDDHCATASDLLISSPNLVSPYATIDLPLDHAVEMVSDESSVDGVYSTPASLQLLPTTASNNASVIDIPRSCLKFIRTLGEGHFGQVYVCEMLERPASCSKLGSSLCYQDLPQLEGTLVAVKVLQHNASELKRSLFEREVKKLLRLKDPNIATMLTFYMDEEPFCIVLEYTCFGDLKSFIRERTAEQISHEQTVSQGRDLLSYGCLIFMASQIASGMKYFEMGNLVHRDLAARNCLVGEDFTIKISDLGTSHHQYAQEYSTVVGQVLLPIRWMAWESILLGSFTTKSDIWSFGVTVWEILTLAQTMPYDGLTDEEVIDNCHNIYCENTIEVRPLEQPTRCPREIYDLLCHCWAKDDTSRPTFHEIHMFLQRKNAGYSPDNEKLATVMRKNEAFKQPFFV